MLSKKLSAAVLMAGLVGFSGAAFAGDTITLNPSATNSGAGAIYAGQGAFTVDNILGGMKSVLDISTTTGTGNWSESGSMIFQLGFLNNSAVSTGFNKSFGSGAYDIYGIFTGSGSGAWVGNKYTVDSVSSFSIKLYASTSTTSGSFGTASSGTDATGGVTQGGSDKYLGIATYYPSFTDDIFAKVDPLSTSATTSLNARFMFAPNPTYTSGVGYFFEAPSPFNISIAGSGVANAGEATYATLGNGYRITTGNNKMGSANLTFEHKIPEPGVLSLAGLALLGLGVNSRRRKAKMAA